MNSGGGGRATEKDEVVLQDTGTLSWWTNTPEIRGELELFNIGVCQSCRLNNNNFRQDTSPPFDGRDRHDTYRCLPTFL